MSIICFISSALGAMEAAEVAGLEAAVVVVVVVAGLEVVGAFGAAGDVCATAIEVIATTAISDVSRVVGLMVAGIVLRVPATRQASCVENTLRFYLFSRASKRRAGNASLSAGSRRIRRRLFCSTHHVPRRRRGSQHPRRAPCVRHRRRRRGKRPPEAMTKRRGLFRGSDAGRKFSTFDLAKTRCRIA